MTNTEAAARIQALTTQILQYNHAYYDLDQPLVSDAAYDQLTQELRDLENQFPELAQPNSPTKHVGGEASSTFHDVRHIVPLLSLLDLFDPKEIFAWFNNYNQPAVSVETKVDGLSCALLYQDGRFTQAVTRGNGRIGEDVTENVRQIQNIPKQLTDAPGTIVVRCEIYMPVYQFKKLNQALKQAGKPLLKNPRNAAAGSLRTKDPRITGMRGLAAVAFAILYHDQDIPSLGITQTAHLAWMDKQGFQTVVSRRCTSPEEIQLMIDTIDGCRNVYDYAIDGAVIKIDDTFRYLAIGNTEKYPRGAVAYKYPPEQKQTVIRDIVLQTGRTGVITPVAVFDPVTLAGTTVVRATLHNQSFMDIVLKGVAIGDTIVIHKSGEIIPEVLQVLHDKRPEGASDFKITTCPVCGSPAVLGADENGNGTQMYCSNVNCPAILEHHLIYWCSDHVMNIDGIGPKIIRALINAGLTRLTDLYRFSEADLAAIKEIGPVRAPKLYANIQESKNRDISCLIAGLGIPGVGRHIGKQLAASFPDMDAIEQAVMQNQLTALDGIGDITAADMKAFFLSNDNRTFLQELKNLGINMQSLSFQTQSAGTLPLTGMTFVITGSFETMSRNEMKAWLEARGAKVSGSISKKTSYLLAGENGGSKQEKAESIGIPIINMDQLTQILARKESQ